MSTIKLGDVASVCRTKNAGAFLLTIDIVFDDLENYRAGKRVLIPDVFASLYQVPVGLVEVMEWDDLRAIKATLPRWTSAGRPGDRDVYGCQQHAPLLSVDLGIAA
jgi:hypothetical protein